MQIFKKETEAEKASKTLNSVRARLAEVDAQTATAEAAMHAAESDAADVALDDGAFGKAADKLAKLQARVIALRTLRGRIEGGLLPAARLVVQGKLRDLIAQRDALQAEVDGIHREARKHLDRVGDAMGIFVPLSALYGGVLVPVDRDTLDPNAFPANPEQLVPKTVAMMNELSRLRARISELELMPDVVEAEAQALLRPIPVEDQTAGNGESIHRPYPTGFAAPRRRVYSGDDDTPQEAA